MRISERNHVTKEPPSTLIGIRLLVVFFSFGTLMSSLTIFLLLFPKTILEPLWRLNPDAHAAFQSLGRWSIFSMIVVGAACASAAAGLAKRAVWGWRLAIAVLVINGLGDTINAVARHDPRTLIGIPVAGALIMYLVSKRNLFANGTGTQNLP